MSRDGTRALGASCAGLLGLAGAFFAGWSVDQEPHTSAQPEVERPALRRRDVTAPPWAPTGSWLIPFVGSLYRTRFAASEFPMGGVEAVLVTPRKEECLGDCPAGLRMVDGYAGARALAKILPTIEADLDRLFESPGMPAAVRASLRHAQLELAVEAMREGLDGGRPPTRALFIGASHPKVAPSARSVGFAMTDLPDPHFDRVEAGEERREGYRLFVSRLETLSTAGRPEILVGVISVGHSVGRPSRPIPRDAGELSLAFGPLWGHFGALCDEMMGLYLGKDGRIHVFGADLKLRAVPQSPELHAAVVALLRRA
jgi:hypothetical protein